MKKFSGFRSLMFVLALLSLTAVAAGGQPITVTMSGAAERPGPGDPDGTGTASFTFNRGLGEVCYWLSVSGIAAPTAAHIHRAPDTVAGPVVIPLAAPTDGTSSGCVSVDRALVKEISKNPEDFYVNVHNAEFPAGAVRAQLDD